MREYKIPYDSPENPQYDPTCGGKRKYIKARQCAAMWRKGKRAGKRCTWYALADSLYCKKHCVKYRGGRAYYVNNTPEKMAKLHQGVRDWWVRMKAIEAEHPGTIREVLGLKVKSQQNKEYLARQKALGIPGNRFVPESQLFPPGFLSDDPFVAKQQKYVAKEIFRLPEIAKPIDEMTADELLTHNTLKSLKRMAELLALKITHQAKDADGKTVDVIDYKAASLVKDTALRAAALQIKVDRNALQATKIDRMHELLQRLKEGEKALVIEVAPVPQP